MKPDQSRTNAELREIIQLGHSVVLVVLLARELRETTKVHFFEHSTTPAELAFSVGSIVTLRILEMQPSQGPDCLLKSQRGNGIHLCGLECRIQSEHYPNQR